LAFALPIVPVTVMVIVSANAEGMQSPNAEKKQTLTAAADKAFGIRTDDNGRSYGR
jgi:hypothetical protein